MARIKKKASGKRHNIWFMIMIGGLLFIALAVVLIIPYVKPVRITDSSLPYEYRIEGNHVVLEKYTGNEEEVVIPERIFLWKVTELGDWGTEGVFKECQSVKKVVMPDSIIEVGPNCFMNCHNLEEVQFSKRLTKLEFVFWNCQSLEYVEIPEKVKVLTETFRNCTNLKEVKMPSGLERIGSGTFGGCISLEKLELPDSLTYINSNAVSDEWLSNPEAEFVTAGKNVLVRYNGSSSTVEVPEGVEYIGVGVFDDHEEIEQIILPKSLKELSIGTIKDKNKLKYIVVKNEDMKYPIGANDKIVKRCPNVTLIAPQGSTTEAYVKGLEYPYPYAESIPE